MKTKILILALAAFCSFSSISAGNCIDNLFNTASRMPNAEKVNLNSFVLGLLKPFSSELKGIKSMSIIDAENISSKDYTRFEKIITQCDSDGYETVTSSNEENEIVRILMKIERENRSQSNAEYHRRQRIINNKYITMKSRIFLLIIVLLSTLQILFANNKIDNLFKKTKELPNAEYYTEDFKKPQVKGVVDGVKAIEVVEADIDNATYLALKKEIEEVDFKPYETILTTSEDDEFVKILIKSTPKKIKEVVVISLYSDEINVVRCKGNLKSDMLEKSKTN